MTKTELGQADAQIIRAGRTAFMLGIPLNSNPYRKNQHFYKLWKIGFFQGKKKDDSKRLANGKYKTHLESLVTSPTCEKCLLPVKAQPNTNESYCNNCGDYYYHTEFEIEDKNATKSVLRQRGKNRV